MTGKEFRSKYCSPCIYTWKRGEEWLYIGKSYHGLRRILAQHTIISRDNIKDDDEIEIWCYPELSNQELLRLERTWIHNCHPRYNKKQGRGDFYYNQVVERSRMELDAEQEE
jgi:hypothetical protein